MRVFACVCVRVRTWACVHCTPKVLGPFWSLKNFPDGRPHAEACLGALASILAHLHCQVHTANACARACVHVHTHTRTHTHKHVHK